MAIDSSCRRGSRVPRVGALLRGGSRCVRVSSDESPRVLPGRTAAGSRICSGCGSSTGGDLKVTRGNPRSCKVRTLCSSLTLHTVGTRDAAIELDEIVLELIGVEEIIDS